MTANATRAGFLVFVALFFAALTFWTVRKTVSFHGTFRGARPFRQGQWEMILLTSFCSFIAIVLAILVSTQQGG